MNVTSVRIFNNDSFVLAISDKDNSIVIYETDFKNDSKNVDNMEVLADIEKEEQVSDPNNEVQVRPSIRNRAASKSESDGKATMEQIDIAKFYKPANPNDDKNKYQKPWLASVRYPTDYIKPPVNNEKPPKIKIDPEYVFGFRVKDCRGNLKYIS